MKPSKGAFLLQAGLIIPLLFLVTFIPGCTRNYSFQISSEPAPKDLFPEIKSRARLPVSGREAGIDLRVFYASGERALAIEALEAVKRAPRFLSQETGTAAKSSASFYLYPLPEGGSIPYYGAKGPGTYTDVFLYRKGEALLSIRQNREWLNRTYPHELAHTFLLDARVRLDDRWLDDGLSEYLASEFGRQNDPEVARGDHRLTPTLVALSRATLGPWDMRDFEAIEKKRFSDPEYAQLLGERMVWRYAAAEELVRRWMGAARKNGIENPLQDLLARVRPLGRAVDWKATRQLAKQQTGFSFEELARVSEGELSAAQAKAWAERAEANLGARVHALSILAALGLPSDASAHDLIPAFSIPSEYSEVKLGWVWQVFHQGGQALATANDPVLAGQLVEIAGARWGANGYRFVPPELWQVFARANRDLALGQLVETVNRSDSGLDIGARANAALHSLTGKDAGWSIEGSPVQRQQAAKRWKAILALEL